MAVKKAKPKQKPQKERFIEFAKSVGADDPKAMERTFGKAVPPKKPKR
jgi:hypothetical protein